MKEEWLLRGAVVPVDVETTAALLVEIHRLIDVVGGMALAQPEFIKHEVKNADDWSEWVCPDPKNYLMKCCDCGLVHEAEFGVVRYKSETERDDCDMVNDPNLQAVFRMRRSEEWMPEDTAHRSGGLPMSQPAQQEPVKLWLWKNFVDGKPEYWAFDNAFPIFMDSHDPQTLGEPCGYAWLNPSRAGRTNVSDEQVLQDVQEALAQPAKEPIGYAVPTFDFDNSVIKKVHYAGTVPLYTTPTQRTWVGLTEEETQAVAKQARSKDHAVTLTNKLLKEKNT